MHWLNHRADDLRNEGRGALHGGDLGQEKLSQLLLQQCDLVGIGVRHVRFAPANPSLTMKPAAARRAIRTIQPER